MSSYFLGIDGGGTKTAFVLIDDQGRLIARHDEPTSYYLEIGLEMLRERLHRGVSAVLSNAQLAPSRIEFAFAGLPAHGEDSAMLPTFDALLKGLLPRFAVGNDMVCSWAGSLAGSDGVSVVAGTGSIAYGEWLGRSARSGGWGEVFGDEGSAYWLAREGLALFSRMADGRLEPGPLLHVVREHFHLSHDLDLCAAINGDAARSKLAQLSRLVSAAAASGDAQAQELLRRAGAELAQLVAGVARRLSLHGDTPLAVSYSGGVFATGAQVLEPLRDALARHWPAARLTTPSLGPELGAALYAARRAGQPLAPGAVQRLQH